MVQQPNVRRRVLLRRCMSITRLKMDHLLWWALRAGRQPSLSPAISGFRRRRSSSFTGKKSSLLVERCGASRSCYWCESTKQLHSHAEAFEKQIFRETRVLQVIFRSIRWSSFFHPKRCKVIAADLGQPRVYLFFSFLFTIFSVRDLTSTAVSGCLVCFKVDTLQHTYMYD